MIRKMLMMLLVAVLAVPTTMVAQQETTIEALQAGAARGDEYSILMLGWSYANGEGVDKNMATAIKYYKQLAEKNSNSEYVAQACYMLGNCYSEGEGVPMNINTACVWWQKAAGMGHERAAEKLKEFGKGAANPTPQQVAKGSTRTITIPGTSVSFNMIYVEGGSFYMGAQSKNSIDGNFDQYAEVNESPVHRVKLDNYYIGEFEVTQGLWKAVMSYGGRLADGFYMRPFTNVWLGGAPSSNFGLGDNYPAYYVSYEDIVNHFIPRLNKLTGMTFRLPTEAEWEYAARGGKNQDYYIYSGSDNIGDVAWYTSNSSSSTHPVGTKSPNSLGIYDMSGNVWEWCSDWYGDRYYSASPALNPQGPTSGSYRVLRGGCWSSDAQYCRVSSRFIYVPDFGIICDDLDGFRLALRP